MSSKGENKKKTTSLAQKLSLIDMTRKARNKAAYKNLDPKTKVSKNRKKRKYALSKIKGLRGLNSNLGELGKKKQTKKK